MRKRAKQAIGLTLKVGLAVALIWYLVRVGALDFEAIGRLANPFTIAALLALVFASIVINNYRWLLLLRAQNFPTSMGSTLSLTFIGLFFNFAMPGGVGGDVVKGYYLLQEHPERRVAASLSIFMDRMSGFFVMIVTAMVALVANWSAVRGNPQFEAVGAAVSALFVAFVAFYAISLSALVQRHPAFEWLFANVPGGKQIKHIYEGLHAYRKSRRALLISFALSLLSQITMVASHAAVGSALGLEVPLSAYWFAVPVGTVVTTLPISIAGIGVGQAAFAYLYQMTIGRSSPLGATAATALQLATFAWALFGALLYLRRTAAKPGAASALGSKDADQRKSFPAQENAIRRG